MIRSWFLELGILVFGFSFIASAARGERVGYQFHGTLMALGSGTTTTLFGIPLIPKNAPIIGTFSYDTTTPGVDVQTTEAAGERTYHQTIDGGYTLDINTGGTPEVKLAASDYVITVADDFQSTSPPETLDVFDIEYNSGFVPAPPPILVNGNSYTATPADLRIELSWPGSTFSGPDEPKLTADRPATPDSAFASNVNGPSPKLIALTSISRIPDIDGDYNRDGVIDNSDYVEWRKKFGSTNPDDLFADGNHNGVVDSADYVVWRGPTYVGQLGAAVPEPTAIYLATIGLILGILSRSGGRRAAL